MDWDIEITIWHLLLIAFLILIAVLGTMLLVSTKKVDAYYLSRGSNTYAGVCVYAHWTWHSDEQAFCTDDYNKALDFVERANKTIK